MRENELEVEKKPHLLGVLIVGLLPFLVLGVSGFLVFHKISSESRNQVTEESKADDVSSVGKNLKEKPSKPQTQVNLQPQSSTPPSKPSSSGSTIKPYIAPVCTKTIIPYHTDYVNVSYLPVGQSSSVGGIDGYIQTCTASSTGYLPSDIRLEPYNKTVYVGVGSGNVSNPNNTSSVTSEAARQQKIAACVRYVQQVSPNSSAYMQCYAIY